MSIPYRARSFMKRIGIFLLVLAILATTVLLFWFVWLDRYIVYTREGLVLDFDKPAHNLPGQTVHPPVIENPITIHYHDGSESPGGKKELTQISGYYISKEELENDLPAVLEQVKKIPAGSAVMLDVKSIYGTFFYSSTVSDSRNTDIDTEAMDSLIKQLCSGDYYVIAQIPAMRDRLYGLDHVPDGLPVSAGYLWMDDDGCYWLNPKRSGTITYWTQIINELRSLGFDEVVLSYFYFPEADSIVYQDDKQAALEYASQTLVNNCATDKFTVSFCAETFFEAPTGRCRIYMGNVAAADAQEKAGQYSLEKPEAQILFLTDNHDTRYDAYSVLRPLSALD